MPQDNGCAFRSSLGSAFWGPQARQIWVHHWADRARRVEHAVQRAVDVDEFGHVVADELKALPADQVGDVLGTSGHEVVHADDLVTLGEKALTQVRAQEAGGAGDLYFRRLCQGKIMLRRGRSSIDSSTRMTRTFRNSGRRA